MRTEIGLVLAATLATTAIGQEAAGPDAVAIRVVRPVEQGERLLGLFRGSRAASPAAALAAWKQATGGRQTLGRPLEAAIAAINPAMIRELSAFDAMQSGAGFEPKTGRLRWWAVVPNDHGRLAAMASALALTDGAVEEPLGAWPVLRLGAPGSALAAEARTPDRRLVLASEREGLALALNRPAVRDDREEASGWHVRLDPAGLRPVKSLAVRRLAEALDAVGCREVRGRLALRDDDDDALTLQVVSRLEPAERGKSTLDPAWLDLIPDEGTLALIALAIENDPKALDALFQALDRVERVDPARAEVAPLRTRLNLLATLARVRPEVDLWPRLRGVTLALRVDDQRDLAGVIVALHAVDPTAATTIVGEVLPRLIAAFLPGDRPLSTRAIGSHVLIGWGFEAPPALPSDRPKHPAGEAIRATWRTTPPRRAGAFWPGRLRRLAPTGSPLAAALAGAPPIVWEGRTDETTASDLVRGPGLRGLVERGLDALPLEPPRDRGSNNEE